MFKKLNSYRNREDGFTLIELLVVVLIIGILAAIAVPIYLNIQKGSHDAAVKSDVSSFLTKASIQAQELGTLPAPTTNTSEGEKLTATFTNNGIVSGTASDNTDITITVDTSTVDNGYKGKLPDSDFTKTATDVDTAAGTGDPAAPTGPAVYGNYSGATTAIPADAGYMETYSTSDYTVTWSKSSTVGSQGVWHWKVTSLTAAALPSTIDIRVYTYNPSNGAFNTITETILNPSTFSGGGNDNSGDWWMWADSTMGNGYGTLYQVLGLKSF